MLLRAAGLSYSKTISFTTFLNSCDLIDGSTSMTLLCMVETYSLQLLASLTAANSPSTN